MKTIGTTKIIGVDHGYGNMKTANHCFPTGIDAYDSEPLFTRDMLVCDGRYYLIGEGHKEFVGEKSQDEDFYLLTLAAVAMELHDEGLTEADVFLAAGQKGNEAVAVIGGQKAFDSGIQKLQKSGFVFGIRDQRIRILRIAFSCKCQQDGIGAVWSCGDLTIPAAV